MIESGFNLDSQDVEKFNPVHNWIKYEALADAAVQKQEQSHYGYEFYSAEYVIEKSIAFNNPWQTSKNGVGRAHLSLLKFGRKTPSAALQDGYCNLNTLFKIISIFTFF